jgi:Flp pilus assembly protein TadD
MHLRRGRRQVHYAALWHPATLLALLCATGCAGWKEKVQPPTFTEQRQQRAAEAVQAFEQHRDSAQLEAALDRWKQGDVTRAEAMIGSIVRRRPDFADAQLRLAEILWSHGDSSAEGPLRAVLQMQPDRPEAHHALGLVLDGTGRSEEARQHLLKAAELEPDNEVYRLTCESLIRR